MRPYLQSGRLSLLSVVVMVAVGSALLLLLWWLTRLTDPDASPFLQTQSLEQRIERLDDGSELLLQPDSLVQVNIGLAQRQVRLQAGAIRITAVPDVRPFVVQAGPLQLRIDNSVVQLDMTDAGVRFQVVQGSVTQLQPEGPRVLPAGTEGTLP